MEYMKRRLTIQTIIRNNIHTTKWTNFSNSSSSFVLYFFFFIHFFYKIFLFIFHTLPETKMRMLISTSPPDASIEPPLLNANANCCLTSCNEVSFLSDGFTPSLWPSEPCSPSHSNHLYNNVLFITNPSMQISKHNQSPDPKPNNSHPSPWAHKKLESSINTSSQLLRNKYLQAMITI